VHAAYLIKFIKDELSRKIKFYKREARTRRWRLIARENYESFIKNFIFTWLSIGFGNTSKPYA